MRRDFADNMPVKKTELQRLDKERSGCPDLSYMLIMIFRYAELTPYYGLCFLLYEKVSIFPVIHS